MLFLSFCWVGNLATQTQESLCHLLSNDCPVPAAGRFNGGNQTRNTWVPSSENCSFHHHPCNNVSIYLFPAPLCPEACVYICVCVCVCMSRCLLNTFLGCSTESSNSFQTKFSSLNCICSINGHCPPYALRLGINYGYIFFCFCDGKSQLWNFILFYSIPWYKLCL